MNLTLRVIAAAAAAATVACAGPLPREAERDRFDWPPFERPGPGETVYRVDEQASRVLARVDPAGPMARLGHSHVVGGRVVGGTLVVGDDGARADFRLRAADFGVDEPAWRRAHGLDPELDAEAIAGTRRNLLGPDVLDAGAHPTLDVRTVDVAGPGWLPDVTLRVRWRGRVHEYTLPVTVRRAAGRIEMAGRLDLHHSDFGLTPFSAAGGALRVSERITVRFEIAAVAERRDVAIIADRSNARESRP